MTTKRRPYNPFENLEEFKDLRSLVRHILQSLEVKEVKVRMPFGFDNATMRSPILLLPIVDMLIGNATFEYIKVRAADILKNVVKQIDKINKDRTAAFGDKFQLYTEIRKDVGYHFQYFDTMNPIRYMSSFKWKILYSTEENGRDVEKEAPCANSELDLKDWHWNILENTLLIRRHLLYEIVNLLDVELENLREELSGNKYTWQEQGPYEIYELLVALIASKRVKFDKGNENTFAHDFLHLFGASDKRFPYYRDKVLSRKKRALFLPELAEALDDAGSKGHKK